MAVDLRCRCEKWPRRCTNRMTQEDARCDLCRRGCSLVAAGDWHAHASDVHFEFEATLRPAR